MRPPWPIGFRMPTNRHPGRRHIDACKKRAGVRGSVSHRRPNFASRSARRATLNPLTLSVRQGVVVSRLSAGRPAACPVEPVFLSSQGSWDAAPTPADRGWEVCKAVGTASAELPRADVHPASPKPPQATRSDRSCLPPTSGLMPHSGHSAITPRSVYDGGIVPFGASGCRAARGSGYAYG